ncbi:MAG: SRPBCC domain-containing protein [Anaerolineaceae bacterium]|nr:SRPBCC domain-containing protein [Anaerolineaceae bacterium]
MSHEAQKHDLVISRVFDAPAERVWNAWKDPEQVKQWWGPDGFTAPLIQIDFREGGTSVLCMSSPEHGTHYSTWQYQEIVPVQRITYIHNLADADGRSVDPVAMGMPPDFPQAQRHTVTFRPVSATQTELTVTEYGWTVGQMMELSRMGMEQCLDKMAVLLAAD